MAVTPTKELIDKIYELISNDATLSAYVNDFVKGAKSISKIKFPYIGIKSDYNKEVESLTMGRTGFDQYTYNFMIDAGTRHMNPQTTWYGDESLENAKKGIIDLEQDLTDLLRNSDLEGYLMQIIEVPDTRVFLAADETGFIYLMEMSITCKIKVRRTV